MSTNGLQKIIMKFKKTGELGVLSGRRLKVFANETVEEIATAVFEKAVSSNYSSANARSVCHVS